MFKQYQKGGQRRTLETPCGWKCVGHPQEVNKKYEIHKRLCKNGCNGTGTTLPEFSKTAGKMNGWGGVTKGNHQPNQMLTTAFVEGERFDILTDAKTIEKSMDDARLTASLMADNIIPAPNPVLSKSQKKRQKQKAKNLNDHLKSVEEHTCSPDCDCKNLGKTETDEELAKLMEAERIASGGNPECACCIITADRIVRETIEGTDYCKITIKEFKEVEQERFYKHILKCFKVWEEIITPPEINKDMSMKELKEVFEGLKTFIKENIESKK